MKTEGELKTELGSFEDIWSGGFWAGHWEAAVKRQPLFLKIFKKCIKPYVDKDTHVLEIGCGGGFYTPHFLYAKQVYCFDALSAKHNKFWERVGKRKNIEYFQVNDFKCKELKDNSINYLFSYNVFVHISYSGVDSYLKNLYNKLRNGANCFIHIIDIKPGYIYDKQRDSKILVRSGFKPSQLTDFLADYDGKSHKPGRLYLYGVDRFCDILDKYKYEIISRDFLGSFKEDVFPSAPVIHFRKVQ